MRNNIQVPFGYEPPAEREKGTLLFYDSFEEITEEELDQALALLERRSFAQLVLYPLHEETVRRMSRKPVTPYYKREDALHDWRRSRGSSQVTVEGWDGKRKKYTPMDSALRFLAEKYPAPYFLYLTPEMANAFASFSSFEEWITRVRLILTEEPVQPHSRLTQFSHRWETAAAEGSR
ncbi:hypothetical protein [Paenibacillus antibioticophila]|uniref:hypothetical protein n=1 Tax=Paenibacillus antibioticophila TaxID=1274374 RepID=UPI0005C8AC17|nr:hypothetical protein [Paenibacillus antibioticophila]